MSKPISKNLHGLIYYSYAALVPLLPEIAGFKNQASAKLLRRGIELQPGDQSALGPVPAITV
jgi:hypothetical protein